MLAKPVDQHFRTVRLDHRNPQIHVLLIHFSRILALECSVVIIAVSAAEARPYSVHLYLGALFDNFSANFSKEPVVIVLPAHLVGERDHIAVDV